MELTFRRQKKFHTKLGCCCSILLTIFLMNVVMVKTIDLAMQRQSMQMVNETPSTRLELDLNSIGFIFGLENLDETIATPTLQYVDWVAGEDRIVEELELVPCDRGSWLEAFRSDLNENGYY